MSTAPFSSSSSTSLQKQQQRTGSPSSSSSSTTTAPQHNNTSNSNASPTPTVASALKSKMQKLATAAAETLGVPANALVPPESRFSLADVPDLSGRVAVVTGGTEGVGFGVVHTLLAHNVARVFILSRSAKVFDEFKRHILHEAKAPASTSAPESSPTTAAASSSSEEAAPPSPSPSAPLGHDPLSRVTWKACDLSHPREVVAVAAEILAETDRLDMLVNCAGRGIMTPQLSDDGIDLNMAINHVGHALLTARLLPLLKDTADRLRAQHPADAPGAPPAVRITNVSSVSHESAPRHVAFHALDEINANHGPNAQYGQSKLATLLHARWLARNLTPHHPNLLVNASHPGVVDTRQSRDHIREPWPVAGQLVRALKPAKKDVFDGCISTVFCATATTASGQYVCPPAVVEDGSPLSRDEALADRLMVLTARLLEDRQCPLVPSPSPASSLA
jgi:NAD(P)-dependent dehydrogenase (short-subunit alcohol dehydrogenase family)